MANINKNYNLKLYYNKSDENQVEKNLELINTVVGWISPDTSLVNPIFEVRIPVTKIVNNEQVIIPVYQNLFSDKNINYLSIKPDNVSDENIFLRYYFIDDIILSEGEIVKFICHEDVLSTFYKFWQLLDAFIVRNEYEYDSMLPDNKLPTISKPEYIIYKGLSRVIEKNKNQQCFILQVGQSPDVTGLVTTDPAYVENENNPYSLVSKFYSCSLLDIMKFADGLYDPTFKDKIKNFTNNPAESVISCILYPINIISLCDNYNDIPVDSVYVGNGKITVSNSCRLLYRTNKCRFRLNINDIPEYITDNFLSYAPYTTGSLFIPFYGFIDIDVNLFIKHSISIDYNINLGSGFADFYIKNENGDILYTGSCQVGVQIDFTTSNAYENFRRKTQVAINTAGNIVNFLSGQSTKSRLFDSEHKRDDKRTKEYKDALEQFNISERGNKISSLSNIICDTTIDWINASVNHYTRGGVSDTWSQFYAQSISNEAGEDINVLQPFIIFRHTQCPILKDNNQLKKYSHQVGRPCQFNKKLFTLKGYTEVGAIHLHNIPAITSEKEELENILKSGFIL